MFQVLSILEGRSGFGVNKDTGFSSQRFKSLSRRASAKGKKGLQKDQLIGAVRACSAVAVPASCACKIMKQIGVKHCGFATDRLHVDCKEFWIM